MRRGYAHGQNKKILQKQDIEADTHTETANHVKDQRDRETPKKTT